MNDEFYSAIKLVSGEEIFSKVCSFIENDEIIILLDHPIIIETTYIQKLEATAIKIIPWMKLTDDTMFIMNMDKIITMTEVKDTNMISIHKKYVRGRYAESNQHNITPNMGYVSSVDEARSSLEKIFKSSSHRKD
jgi:hypothetical protein